ncbi:hypothetical protein PPN31114_03331 [Pandoraea pneumonica]|jgi:hypothetical protein|uniref:Uncharacterized protein n=1 Tax=Pandoraea pneumonica TaxID=2508299 RepID=A0A5E4WMJ4_9BURK|nr:hypothetical protein PPN31114_03331 [Pandoraea pneumonica]
MIKISPETRAKLRCVVSFAVIGSSLTGVTVGRMDFAYDARDVVGLVFAAISALWLFCRR